jgi:prepilin peptidase CpaA
MFELISNVLLVGALGVAVTTDLRARRIPNLLTFPMLGVGFLLNALASGTDGFVLSGQGALLALAILLPLHIMRGLGAGDVKLMAAIGALKGPEFLLYTFAWAAIFGGALAMVGLVRSRRVGLAFSYLAFFRFFPRPDGTFISAGRLPYAPAIALGALLVLAGVRWIGN